MALERQGHLQELEAAALQDVLTGLGNRRAFELDLKAQVARAEPFGLMILDLDGLKLVNDALGHEAGDRLLQLFGRHLCAGMPPEDRCYRLGGDEFAVLLQALPGAEAGLYEQVRALTAGLRTQGFAQTDVSAGVAFFPAEASRAAALLRLADQRMYAMKAQHRQAAGAAPPETT
ncbi:GGDEF domain-containing protein [Deinococcus multiflagellatus]|nr:GGDEF domain-containing protein [Deinococcus multiflagellatus]